jgi:anti-sigma regulatory factor (Ser/Thr protein kinase)
VAEDFSARLEIAAEPAAAAAVRRWLRDLLSDWVADSLQTVQLLTCELVTNAILHTDDMIEISVDRTEAGVTVEVIDRNPAKPIVKEYGSDAVTGRGLRLVDALSDQWGVRGDERRKSVWFELSNGPHPEPAALEAIDDERWLDFDVWTDVEPDSPSTLTDGPAGRQVVVCLNKLPVALYLEAEEHHDGALRELTLMRRMPPGEQPSLSARLAEIGEVLTDQFGAANRARRRHVDAARRAGATTVDLAVPFRANAHATLAAVADLLDEFDEICAQGHMLTRPSSPELRRFRRWYTDEVIRQLDGQPPSPWPYASPDQDANRSGMSSL